MSEYSIKPDVLWERGRALHAQYSNAKPYPHIVIDDFFPTHVVDEVLAEFPKPGDIEWQEFKRAREMKLACCDEALLGAATRRLIWEMNSQVFVRFLELLTGID